MNNKFTIKSSILFLLLLFSTSSLLDAKNLQDNINSTKLNLEYSGITLSEIFEIIDSKTGFNIAYGEYILNNNSRLDISYKSATVADILDDLGRKNNFSYKVDNEEIAISKKQTNNQQAKVNITGTVNDENGEPLPGVSVVEEGTGNGTSTDFDGKFSIEASVGSKLVFSFIGYQSGSHTVSSAGDISISLQLDSQVLDDIVIVGYGTQKKTTITGSVSAIKGEELAEIPTPNVSQSLAGRVAGVSMRPNGGQPGFDDPDIHIRGIVTTGGNKPLVIVDGIKRDNIRQVNPNTIESLTILKDAAAVAPYGIGGANGVILITTKKGKSGEPKVVLNSSYGFQNPTYIPQMLSAQDYLKLSNEAYFNATPGGITPPNTESFINDYNNLHAQDPDLYPDSDFTSLIKRWQPMQNHSLEFSGGTDKVTYFASLGYYDQQGVFDPVNYNRYNYSLNVEMKATKTTKIGVSLIGTFENTNEMDPGENVSHLFRAGYKFVPTQALEYSDGIHWGQSAGSSPLGALNSEGYKRFNKNTMLASVTIDQEIPWVKGLSVKGVFSYDPTQETIKEWHLPFKYHILDSSTNPYSYTEAYTTQEGVSPLFTSLNQGYNKWQNFTYQAYINYANTFGDHSINAVFVAEGRNNTFETFWAGRTHYQLDIDELAFGPSDKDYFSNFGTSDTGSELGYVYRLSYSYKDRYMIETAGRYDGHYVFAPDARWAFFPSVSAGWRISEESFMENKEAVDNLKLRGSWGQSGNLPYINNNLATYQYMPGYQLYGDGYVFGPSTLVQGAFTDIEPNPYITWEISTKYDIGVDLNMWNGLLNVEFDYFHENRTGMLLQPQVTMTEEYGLWLAQENKGVMKNDGVELTIGTHKVVNEDFDYSISGNFSYAKNQMIEVFQSDAQAENPNRSLVGKPFGTQYGYKALGLFSTDHDKNGDGIINHFDGYNVQQFGDIHPGDIMYADLSGPDGVPDGVIDVNDETQIGYPVYPLMTFGLTADARWKGFDAALFFQGSAMSSLNIKGFQTVPFENNASNTSYEYYNNRWTVENQDARYPRATPSPYVNNDRNSSFWMINTSLLRLKTATLGYTLPKTLTDKAGIDKVRFHYTGINLLTLSGIDFLDPEMGYSGRETAYPVMQTHTFGVTVNF